MPGTSRYLYLDDSPLSIVSALALEALTATSHDPLGFSSHSNQHLPHLNRAELALPSPSTIRFLLSRYSQCVHPRFEILDPSILHQDGMNINKLPDSARLQTLMACAIAAMDESYHNPSWHFVAQACRELAEEMIASLVSTGTAQSLTCVLLLLIFELADPFRALTWDLLDLAARNLLQLGWHRNEHSVGLPDDSAIHGQSIGVYDQRHRLIAAMQDIDGYVGSPAVNVSNEIA